MVKKMSLSLAAAAMVASSASAMVYVEPTVGYHNLVTSDSEVMKKEVMGGGRIGTDLTDRINLEAGLSAGKADGKNGHNDIYEKWANIGATYALAESKPGNLVPYLGLGTGNLHDRGGMEYAAGLKYILANNDALRLDVRDHNHAGRNDVITTLGYAIALGTKQAEAPAKPCCDTQPPVVAPVPVVEEAKPVVEAPKPAVEEAKPAAVEPAAPVVVKEDVPVEAIVYFDFDKSVVKKSEAKKLDTFIAASKDYKEVDVDLTGYTDVLGTKGYNAKLSHKRAEAVKSYLAAHGCACTVNEVTGKGVKGPQKGKAARAKNRVVVVSGKGIKEVTK